MQMQSLFLFHILSKRAVRLFGLRLGCACNQRSACVPRAISPLIPARSPVSCPLLVALVLTILLTSGQAQQQPEQEAGDATRDSNIRVVAHSPYVIATRD